MVTPKLEFLSIDLPIRLIPFAAVMPPALCRRRGIVTSPMTVAAVADLLRRSAVRASQDLFRCDALCQVNFRFVSSGQRTTALVTNTVFHSSLYSLFQFRVSNSDNRNIQLRNDGLMNQL